MVCRYAEYYTTHSQKLQYLFIRQRQQKRKGEAAWLRPFVLPNEILSPRKAPFACAKDCLSHKKKNQAAGVQCMKKK